MGQERRRRIPATVSAVILLNCLLTTSLATSAFGEDEHHQQITSELPSIYYTEPGPVGSGLYNPSSNSIEQGFRGLTELHGGKIRGNRTLEQTKSPYVLKEDLYIERGATLNIEPGVEVRFVPTVGITVRGTILALVSNYLFFSCSLT